jgi:formylglycine-generating enzyme required for sulfatase activity
MNSDGETHPVASLIPNDLGLFDTLGNVREWCDSAEPHGADGAVVGDLWGGFSHYSMPKALDKSVGIEDRQGYWRDPSQGFRVVRTKKIR